MRVVLIVVLIVIVVTARVVVFRTHRKSRQAIVAASATPPTTDHRTGRNVDELDPPASPLRDLLGDVGLVAGREIKERLRGRIFRVGTIIVLLGIGAAVVVPTLHKANGTTPQRIGIVGTFPAALKPIILAAGKADNDNVTFVDEPSVASAEVQLRQQKTAFAVIDSRQILLWLPATASQSPADTTLVQDTAQYLGIITAYEVADLTPSQESIVSGAKPVAVKTLAAAPKNSTNSTSIIGLILMFFMLQQYCTWILIGVMQEKSSRVVEVLLAVVRPIQLLAGKVLGIGVVALAQAALLVGFALVLSDAVGSDVLRGSNAKTLLAELLWLVLGYSLYCWVYAAAGSMAERQDQVQTLALPLSLPILFAYIYSIATASSGDPNLFFKVLSYVPLTAPFCMSVMVGLGRVAWWQFAASCLISLVSTAGVALFAARIYRRAVLRTGGRVRVREALGSS